MADVALRKSTCGSCGIELREGSMFCYGCGEPISTSEKPNIDVQTSIDSNNGQVAGSSDTARLDAPLIANEPLAPEKLEMRSAASMRRGAKAYNRKPVEVVWVRRETPGLFVVVSIVLVILVAILLSLALYLK